MLGDVVKSLARFQTRAALGMRAGLRTEAFCVAPCGRWTTSGSEEKRGSYG